MAEWIEAASHVLPRPVQTLLQDGADPPAVIYQLGGGGDGGDVSASMNAARHDTVLTDRWPPPRLSNEKEVPDCEADMYQWVSHIMALGIQYFVPEGHVIPNVSGVVILAPAREANSMHWS